MRDALAGLHEGRAAERCVSFAEVREIVGVDRHDAEAGRLIGMNGSSETDYVGAYAAVGETVGGVTSGHEGRSRPGKSRARGRQDRD